MLIVIFKISTVNVSHNAPTEQATDTLIRSSLQVHASEPSSGCGGSIPLDACKLDGDASIFVSLPISRPPMDRRNLTLTNSNLVDFKLALLPSRY